MVDQNFVYVFSSNQLEIYNHRRSGPYRSIDLSIDHSADLSGANPSGSNLSNRENITLSLFGRTIHYPLSIELAQRSPMRGQERSQIEQDMSDSELDQFHLKIADPLASYWIREQGNSTSLMILSGNQTLQYLPLPPLSGLPGTGYWFSQCTINNLSYMVRMEINEDGFIFHFDEVGVNSR